MAIDYDSDPGINFSTLKVLWDKSPKHYKSVLGSGRVDTPFFAAGRLFHCMVLEPDAVDERFVRHEQIDRRTTAGKARAKELNEDSRTKIDEETWGEVSRWRDAVASDRIAAQYLRGLTPEVPMFWTDPETGIRCKGRPDGLIVAGDTTIVGLKTAEDVRIHHFQRKAARLGYHLQWAFYHDGARECGHDVRAPMVEIVVEKNPPYDVVVFEIHDDTIDDGRIAYRDALKTLADSRERGDFRGVSRGLPVHFSLPKWAHYSDDDDLSGLEF